MTALTTILLCRTIAGPRNIWGGWGFVVSVLSRMRRCPTAVRRSATATDPSLLRPPTVVTSPSRPPLPNRQHPPSNRRRTYAQPPLVNPITACATDK